MIATLLYITYAPQIAVWFIVAAFVGYLLYRHGSGGDKPAPAPPTVDDYVATHGEPEEVVVLDATRANELNAVVLLYADSVVLCGEAIARSAIVGVTFNNSSIPYIDNRYQIVLATTLPSREAIHLPSGSDAALAAQAATQLHDALAIDS